MALGVVIGLVGSGLGGPFLYRAVVQEHSTFSIVAVDPASGDVGIAGASCVPISAGAMTTLVPGMGAAATQAVYWPANHKRVYDLLQQGNTATGIIESVSDGSYDAEAGIRQYGAVTIDEEGVHVAGFTGRQNNDWAGDQQDATAAVSVQGNTLESAAVVAEGLAAYKAESVGAAELPDRLLRALEAASAAGGDRRCNNADVQQTAQAAFIAVSKADQLPFAATLGKDPSPDDPARPWLYISVIEPKGGPNPLLALRSQYDAWRSENLAPCGGCDLEAIQVPRGGDPDAMTKAMLRLASRVGLPVVGLAFVLSAGLLASICVIAIVRRRRRRASAYALACWPLPRPDSVDRLNLDAVEPAAREGRQGGRRPGLVAGAGTPSTGDKALKKAARLFHTEGPGLAPVGRSVSCPAMGGGFA